MEVITMSVRRVLIITRASRLWSILISILSTIMQEHQGTTSLTSCPSTSQPIRTNSKSTDKCSCSTNSSGKASTKSCTTASAKEQALLTIRTKLTHTLALILLKCFCGLPHPLQGRKRSVRTTPVTLIRIWIQLWGLLIGCIMPMTQVRMSITKRSQSTKNP